MRRLHLPALIVAAFLWGYLVVPAHAESHAKVPVAHAPPDKPCHFDNRMDIEIVNGIWFECSCEALMVGSVCDWYEITEPAHDPHSPPKLKRAAKAKAKHRRVVIHAALPAVVS